MNKVFKKIAISVISLGIVLFTVAGCSDDIILEPLDSIVGSYEGHFYLTDLTQGGAADTLISIDILWDFRELTYQLDDTTQTICTPKGDYVLSGDQIKLDENFDGNSGGVCNPSLNPLGDFSIRRPADSLILTQSTPSNFYEIRLKRK